MKTKAIFMLIVVTSLKQGLGVNLSCDDSDICVPSGSVVTCTCTVEDEDGTRSTLWDGTAFMSQCSQSRDQIVLLHSQFDVIEPLECGNRISAIPINQEFRNYTSNASITVNISNNGSSIRCSLAGLSPVGIKLLNVGEIPPPPSNLGIPLASFSRGRFSLTWTEPMSVFGGVGSYEVVVRSDQQGDTARLCGNMSAPRGGTATVRSFTDWVTEGQTCNFSVSTLTGDNCNFTSTPSQEVSITLQGPDPAIVKQITLDNPIYIDNLLSVIDVSFVYRQETPVSITDDVTSITTNFSITYNSESCTMIVPSSCDEHQWCNYTLTLDNCSVQASGNGMISVIPLNIIGSGNSTSSNVIESMNPLFTVNTITTANSPDISLQLRFRTMFTSATCDLTYGLGAGCGNLTLNKHFRQTNSTIMFINFTLTSSGAYCYQVICAVMPDPSSSLAPIAQGAINYQTGGGGGGDGGGGAITQFPPWAIAVLVLVILIGGGGGGSTAVACAIKKPWKKDSNETKSSDDSPDGRGQQLVPHPDDSKLYVDPNSIEHEQALTGDEYAMVDMASKKAKPTDTDAANQALYQDPSSIERKQAPTGDEYAMPQQKGRKKGKRQGPSVDPESVDVAAMYSTVDTSKKKTQLTYAQIDVGSDSGDKPVPQSTPYATVVS